MSSSSAVHNHAWSFFRAGGFDQVQFKTGGDLRNLGQLDQKLWAALACPTQGLEFDPRTLALLDSDKDGRIRAPEVLAAVAWACARLKDPATLLQGSASLPLAGINDTDAEGQQLLASAKRILISLGKDQSEVIAADDLADTARIHSNTRFNGDGIVPADAADDAATGEIIVLIADTLGAKTDRSGKPGIDRQMTDAFFAEARALSAWLERADIEGAALMPLGAATPAAGAACLAVRAKIDDFFARGRLAAFDQRAMAAVNRGEDDYLPLAGRDFSAGVAELAGFPLAHVEPGQPLPLRQGLNPAWAAPMAEFVRLVVEPLLGAVSTLTEAQWLLIQQQFAGYTTWLAARPQTRLEKLDADRIKALAHGDFEANITGLLARDLALEQEFTAFASVTRLVLLNRDLVCLLNNFVSFRDFYSKDRKACFQAGTLYLDGRACELCVPVADPARHAALAGMAKNYLAYCDCTRPGGEKMTIAAAFTSGDSDNLMVGRNGVFYDRKGRDWDATVTRIVDNPISVPQAFWAPYKKLVRLIEEQVAKRAAAAEAESDAKISSAATFAANADKQLAEDKEKAKTPPPPRRIDVGTVAALGVAVGALGAFLTTVLGYLTGLLALPFWMIVLAMGGIILAISAPSMLIAWLKLRQRNLGPILDANGWAINGRVAMNVSFGASLTTIARLPSGSKAALDDPFAEKRGIWPRLIWLLIAVCFVFSLINDLAPQLLGNWYQRDIELPVVVDPPAAPNP